jgi:hypothetical protein
MKKFYITAIISLMVFGVIGIIRAKDRKTDGFSLDRITTRFADNPNWDITPTSDQITRTNEALNQPYYYLAHGFQCFAFISKDEKYVLKFIRHQRLRPPFIIDWLPNLPYIKELKEQKIAQGKKRANYLFRSLKVSFDAVPYETGLLMVHINKTKEIYPTISLFDKAGTEYKVSLDSHEFVLQEKALHIKPELCRLMSAGKTDEAKERITQIFTLLVTCAKKGIADNDQQLIRKNNLGFLPDRAIYIDTGKLARKEWIKTADGFERDLKRLDPLYDWLKQNYPELATHFSAARLTAYESMDFQQKTV